MTTRVFQGSAASLVSQTTTPRVFQGAAAALVSFVPVNSSPRVFQGITAALVRNYPVNRLLEYSPTQLNARSNLPRKPVLN